VLNIFLSNSSSSFQVEVNAMLNSCSLLLFPDLGSADPRTHDQLNSCVEEFMIQFRQTGYCIIVLPSGTYRRPYSNANWKGIDWDPMHERFVRQKLSNLINHMFLLVGRNASKSTWSNIRSAYKNFKGCLTYQPRCSKCFNRCPSFDIWVDLRLCPLSDTMWLNINAKFPETPADLCNECSKSILHERPNSPESLDQSEVRVFSFRLKGCVIDVILIPQVMQGGEESSGDDASERMRGESSGDESEASDRTFRYELDSLDSDRETRDNSPAP